MAHGGYPSPVSGSVRAKILELHQATSQAAGHDHGVVGVGCGEKDNEKLHTYIIYILSFIYLYLHIYDLCVYCIVYCIYHTLCIFM